MTEKQARMIAIEFAKAAIESPSGGATFYFNAKSADDIADFIEKLTERLTSE